MNIKSDSYGGSKNQNIANTSALIIYLDDNTTLNYITMQNECNANGAEGLTCSPIFSGVF